MHSLVLIVHSDVRRAREEFAHLESFGIKPYVVHTPRGAIEILGQWSFDVLLLEGEGLRGDLRSALTELRTAALPIVVLAKEVDEAFHIRCLESGASEVIKRPVDGRLTGLILRKIIGLAASKARAPDAEVRVGPLHLDTRRSKATVAGIDLQFTRQQFEIALLLAVHAGEFVDRPALAEASRQRLDQTSRSVDMQISKIRKKLRSGGVTTLSIEGVYGRGYCLCERATALTVSETELAWCGKSAEETDLFVQGTKAAAAVCESM